MVVSSPVTFLPNLPALKTSDPKFPHLAISLHTPAYVLLYRAMLGPFGVPFAVAHFWLMPSLVATTMPMPDFVILLIC